MHTNRHIASGLEAPVQYDPRKVGLGSVILAITTALFLVAFPWIFVFFADQAGAFIAVKDPKSAQEFSVLAARIIPWIWALAGVIFIASLLATVLAFKAGMIKGQRSELQQKGVV